MDRQQMGLFLPEGIGEEEMKVILHYPDMGKEAEKEIVDWICQIIASPVRDSPLKYVEDVEVHHDLVEVVEEKEVET